MMDAKKKCHYCEQEGEYTQLVGDEPNYFMSLVCKKHLEMDLIS
jgi:hypothetical protein